MRGALAGEVDDLRAKLLASFVVHHLVVRAVKHEQRGGVGPLVQVVFSGDLS